MANTAPIFVKNVRHGSASSGTTANTALDGTGTLVPVFTAGSEGSRIESVYITHLGTNVATVMRFFVNGALIHEETLASNTISQTAASVQVAWLAGLVLPASAVLSVTIGTAVASGFKVVAVGGDY